MTTKTQIKVSKSNPLNSVPEQYRMCMAKGRHDFYLGSGSTIRGQVVSWFICWECSTQRLTLRSPDGTVEHTYARPIDYVKPDGLTTEHKREYLLWIDSVKTLNVPEINRVSMHETFSLELN